MLDLRNLKSLLLGGAVSVVAVLASVAAAKADALPAPSMSASLAANPDPFEIDTGIATLEVGGAVSGLAYYQDTPNFGLHSRLDLSNGQVWIEKTDGWWQF